MSETKVWYHYRMLAPVREWYQDDGSRVLARVPVKSNIGVTEVALIGDEGGPESIRVRLEHPTGHFSEEQSRLLLGLTAHMLTCLRTVDNCEADFASYSGQFMAILTPADSEGRPGLKIQIEQLIGIRPPFPTLEIESTFVVTFERRALFDLLTDSCRSSLPLQYRYLSLFKVLEHEFQVGGEWGGRLRDFLAPHNDEFQRTSGSARSLHSEVHDLRDRAAHIKIGKADSFGITGIGSRDAKRIDQLLPLLHRVVMDHIVERYRLKRLR